MDKKKKQALQEAFNKADTNGDGQLDLEEFINHFKSQGLNFTEILISLSGFKLKGHGIK